MMKTQSSDFESQLIDALLAVFYAYGYTTVPADALMRVIGGSKEFSQQFDGAWVNIPEMLGYKDQPQLTGTLPLNTTLH